MHTRFVDNYFLAQLGMLSHTLSAEFHRYLKSRGVSPTHWRILLHLSEIDGLLVSQLAEKTCYEQSRVSRAIEKLSDSGLVERRPCNIDRRRVNVCITEKGEAFLVPLILKANEHEKKVLSVVPKQDRDRLKSILNDFTKNHVDFIIEAERVDRRRRVLNTA